MNYDLILIRYGELSLKSTYVRHSFESTLIRNIKKALTKEAIPHTITKDRGRIYLTTPDNPRSLTVLPRIFGIVSFSPALSTASKLDDISTYALQLAKDTLTKETSFAIRATRVGTHPYTSQEVAKQIGSHIVQATCAHVDLTNPDVELFIEIRDNKAFLFTEKISGAGGLPLGTQGRILALIQNPSSLLAAWFLMRRGCDIVVANTEKTNETLIRSFLTQWHAEAPIIFVDPAGVKITEDLITIAMNHDCDALITGHTLQDPARALSDIRTLKKNIPLPILTPLIAMDDKEIQTQCKKRGIPL